MTILYVGKTSSTKTIKELNKAGIRELTQRTAMPPKRVMGGWALDNGCFEDFTQGRPFDGIGFERAVKWAAGEGSRWPREPGTPLPDFVVIPDVVASPDSLAFSRGWWEREHRFYGHLMDRLTWYFVVQNGMEPGRLDLSWAPIRGIFVGGDMEWKISTGGDWVKWAHQRGMKCHIGRATTTERVRWARRIGADSIDGNGPLWTEGDLKEVIRVLNEPLGQEGRQMTFAIGGRRRKERQG